VLEELQFTNPFFSMVFHESMIYRSYYERKLFVFAISNILFMGQPKDAAELLKQLILMLIRQQRIEQNQKLRKEKLEETNGKRKATN
jgi:hypothetical protein